jgi:hypothetical protein
MKNLAGAQFPILNKEAEGVLSSAGGNPSTILASYIEDLVFSIKDGGLNI